MRPGLNFHGGYSYGMGNSLSGGGVGFNLDAQPVLLTSGPVIGIRFLPLTLDPITEVWVQSATIVGTGGQITAQIYSEQNQANGAARPSTTTRGGQSDVVNVNTSSIWYKLTFATPYTPTVIGEVLWIVIWSPNGTVTNCPAIATAGADSTKAGFHDYFRSNAACHTQTAGFSANGTVAAEMPCLIKCGSAYYGQIVGGFAGARGALFASNQLERGIRWRAPHSGRIRTCVAFLSSNFRLCRVYNSSGLPGGTTGLITEENLWQQTNKLSQGGYGLFYFTNPPIVQAGQEYLTTFTLAVASSTAPDASLIINYAANSTTFDAIVDANLDRAPYGIQDNGAGDWNNLRAGVPNIHMVYDNQFIPNFSASFSG